MHSSAVRAAELESEVVRREVWARVLVLLLLRYRPPGHDYRFGRNLHVGGPPHRSPITTSSTREQSYTHETAANARRSKTHTTTQTNIPNYFSDLGSRAVPVASPCERAGDLPAVNQSANTRASFARAAHYGPPNTTAATSGTAPLSRLAGTVPGSVLPSRTRSRFTLVQLQESGPLVFRRGPS